MAQTNYTPISLYYSTTASAAPTAGNLVNGELAINITDGKLYYKDNTGTVKVIAGSGGTGIVAGSNTQIQFNNSGVFGASANLTWDGTYLTANSIKNSALTSGRVTYAGASGLLQDSANLTFDGTTLTANALTVSNAVTLSGGTANGVLYLNGSKVATSGSALTFDGSTFSAIANAVFDRGSINSPVTVSLRTNMAGASSKNIIEFRNNAISGNPMASIEQYDDGSTVYGDLLFKVNNAGTNTEGMRLTSTGLGIGTSSVTNPLTVVSALATTKLSSSTTTNQAYHAVTNASGNMYFGVNNSANSFFAAAAYAGIVWHDGAYPIVFGTNNTERMRLDSSGNLGLGVTPSAWGSDTKAVQMAGSTFSAVAAAARLLNLTNCYWDGTNFRFTGNGTAQQFRISAGTSQFEWHLGASGTTGNIVSFTQAMTLDASGNLGIGTTSPYYPLDVRRDSGTYEIIRIQNTTAGAFLRAVGNGGGSVDFGAADTSASTAIIRTASTERARIDSSGNLGLGVTPSAWSTGNAIEINRVGNSLFGNTGVNFTMASGAYFNGGWKYSHTGVNVSSYSQIIGVHAWNIASSGTAGNAISFTQAMTLDASGRLGIGTTSPTVPLEIAQSATTYTQLRLANTSAGGNGGQVTFAGAGNVDMGWIKCNYPGEMLFGAYNGSSVAERARITSGGYFCVGSTTDTRNIYAGADNSLPILTVRATAASGTVYGINANFNGQAPNNTTSFFLQCNDTGAERATIRSNGGLANYSANDVNLSDRREKTNFAPAGEYLSKICAIPVQTFNYIDQNLEEDAGLTLGVVAQDVQAVAPELVMESNWGTKENPKMRLSIYQTDLQYALMKCIQEQQAIIEQLKARLDAANL